MEANPTIPCHHCQRPMRLFQTVDRGPLIRSSCVCAAGGFAPSTNQTGAEFSLHKPTSTPPGPRTAPTERNRRPKMDAVCVASCGAGSSNASSPGSSGSAASSCVGSFIQRTFSVSSNSPASLFCLDDFEIGSSHLAADNASSRGLERSQDCVLAAASLRVRFESQAVVSSLRQDPIPECRDLRYARCRFRANDPVSVDHP